MPGKKPNSHKMKRLRFRLFKEQGGRCMYCGIYMTPATPSRPTSVTLEHVIPLALHVPGERHQYGAACRTCNNVRGTLFDQGIIGFEAQRDCKQ